MRFLILNVSSDGRKIRGTHAECRIALLPCEGKAFFSCPPRGIRFHGVDGFGEREGRRDLDEEMNVIVRSADGVDENSLFFADTGRVGPEARLKILRDELGAVFGAEDGVDCVLSVRVRHVPHLRRLAIVYLVDPARQKAAGWANLWRTYGAREGYGFAASGGKATASGRIVVGDELPNLGDVLRCARVKLKSLVTFHFGGRRLRSSPSRRRKSSKKASPSIPLTRPLLMSS